MHKMAGSNSEGIEYLKDYLSSVKEKGDRSEEVKVCCNLGIAYHRLGNFQESLQYFKESLSIAIELGDRASEGRASGNLANAHNSLGNFRLARDYHKRDLSIAKEVGDFYEEGKAHVGLGDAYIGLGNFHEAIDCYQKHMSISKKLCNRLEEGVAYSNLGKAYYSQGNFQDALEYNEKGLAIAKEVGDISGEGIAYDNLGSTYCSLGNFHKSIEYHSKGLSIAKQTGNRAGEGESYCNLGIVYSMIGNFQEAIECSKKSLLIAKDVGDRSEEGKCYCNLGNAFHSFGKIQEAKEYHTKHLSIAKELGNKAAEGRAYSNLGNVYDYLGNYEKAIEFHKKDLSIAKEIGDRSGEGKAYGNLGNAFYSLRNFEEAIEHQQKCLSIIKEVGDRCAEGMAFGNLANSYCRLGDYQKAIEYHNKNLSIAKEVGDRPSEGIAYGCLGTTYYNLENFQEAIECQKKRLSISKELGNRDGEASTYRDLGSAYNALGNFSEGLECFQSSVKLFDVIRGSLQSEDTLKISFRDINRDAYSGLWETLLELGKINEALCAAEQGRAQVLIDSLKIQYGLTELSSASLESEETISYISNELSTKTVFLGLLPNKIVFWFIDKQDKVEFREIGVESETAEEDSIAVLLETTLEEIGAGVGVRCENRSLDNDSDDDDVGRCGDGGDNDDDGDGGDDDADDDNADSGGENEEQAESSQCTVDSLKLLHDAIIGPVADLCQDDELIIVPDGALCLAPFSALSKSIRIRIVPSLTSLRLITDAPKDYHRNSGVLLIGDPCLEEVKKPRYRPLPFAKKEVEMIGEILKIAPLTGREANKAEVLQRITSVALVHIAAHGRKETGEIALAPNPGWEKDQGQKPTLRSKIKSPKEEYYILKMADLLAVKLRAKLIVLSCCHSGRGAVKSEGVVGIARAFLAAGARSVVASLWAISDEATLEFMKSFYQHLTDGKSASVALHAAMKSLRDSENVCDVKHWAPFVLIGDDVTIEFGKEELEHGEYTSL